ncbi:cardiolipin synthase [Stieleria maiorica]|nr:cardiolipin synthase [Stieleria maiorica]
MIDILDEVSNSWSVVVPTVLTALELGGLVSAWHAINKVRTSQGAVAWAVGLVALPILVLPLYWVFGRNRFAGYREAIRVVEQQHKDSVEAARRALYKGKIAAISSTESVLGGLADILGAPVSHGNRFELLIDGGPFFERLLQQIASAQRYVYAQFYIIRDDELGNQFADALCERARAGCAVRLLYDEIGSVTLSARYLQKLRDGGVDVHAFNTRQGWINRFQLNFRNHRKSLVVDGRRTIVGGLNVGDEYLGRVDWTTRWRDTGLFVDGPVAQTVQAVFAKDYYWATRSDLPEAVWVNDSNQRETTDVADEATTASPPEHTSGSASGFATGPTDQLDRATMMFAAAAGCSKHRLWISTPYFVPDETCINALSMALARGIDVRIIVPTQTDQWLAHLAGFYYEELFESIGIPVYRYKDGFLHQKCVLVDDQLVLIGSTNLDNRSLYLNFELMLAADEPKLIRQVAEMLQQDFKDSVRADPRRSRLRPWYVRIGTVLARLFSPVL